MSILLGTLNPYTREAKSNTIDTQSVDVYAWLSWPRQLTHTDYGLDPGDWSQGYIGQNLWWKQSSDPLLLLGSSWFWPTVEMSERVEGRGTAFGSTILGNYYSGIITLDVYAGGESKTLTGTEAVRTQQLSADSTAEVALQVIDWQITDPNTDPPTSDGPLNKFYTVNVTLDDQDCSGTVYEFHPSTALVFGAHYNSTDFASDKFFLAFNAEAGYGGMAAEFGYIDYEGIGYTKLEFVTGSGVYRKHQSVIVPDYTFSYYSAAKDSDVALFGLCTRAFSLTCGQSSDRPIYTVYTLNKDTEEVVELGIVSSGLAFNAYCFPSRTQPIFGHNPKHPSVTYPGEDLETQEVTLETDTYYQFITLPSDVAGEGMDVRIVQLDTTAGSLTDAQCVLDFGATDRSTEFLAPSTDNCVVQTFDVTITSGSWEERHKTSDGLYIYETMALEEERWVCVAVLEPHGADSELLSNLAIYVFKQDALSYEVSKSDEPYWSWPWENAESGHENLTYKGKLTFTSKPRAIIPTDRNYRKILVVFDTEVKTYWFDGDSDQYVETYTNTFSADLVLAQQDSNITNRHMAYLRESGGTELNLVDRTKCKMEVIPSSPTHAAALGLDVSIDVTFRLYDEYSARINGEVVVEATGFLRFFTDDLPPDYEEHQVTSPEGVYPMYPYKRLTLSDSVDTTSKVAILNRARWGHGLVDEDGIKEGDAIGVLGPFYPFYGAFEVAAYGNHEVWS